MTELCLRKDPSQNLGNIHGSRRCLRLGEYLHIRKMLCNTQETLPFNMIGNIVVLFLKKDIFPFLNAKAKFYFRSFLENSSSQIRKY